MRDVRPSPIAGTWYPADAKQLEASIDSFLKEAPDHIPDGEILGIIVPHAGHRYSGEVASHAFRLLCNASPQVVAVLSPYHHPHPGRVLTSGHEAYRTPLGEIAVAWDLLANFEIALKEEGIKLHRVTQDQEHSLEIELPFLQCSLKYPFRLIPLMLRDQSIETALAVGRSLAGALQEERSLLVASTDLSHFYPAELAQSLDAEMLKAMETLDPRQPIQVEAEGRGFACGRGAVAASLKAAKELGANRVKILHYAHSGHVTGDLTSVVGYGSGIILKEETPIKSDDAQ